MIRKILKTQYFKSISLLTTGSLIAQIITILCSPILTRLYTKEELGIYGYILSIASVFWAVMNCRYDMSIVTEKDETAIYPLIKLSFYINVFVSILVSFGYFGYIYFIKTEYKSYSYTALIMLILLFSYGITNILTSYNNRKKEYKIITSVSVIRTSCQNIGAVLFGFFNTGSLGLLLPYALGQFFGIRKQSQSIKQNINKIVKASKNDVINVMVKHKRQPLFSTPAMFANSF